MPLVEKSKENRSYQRIGFNLELRYQTRGKPDFDNAVSSDISCGGVRFTSSKFLSTTTSIMFEINVLNRILHPVGRVAWSAPIAHSDRNQLGIQFVEFDLFEKNYLRDFINMQLG